MANYLAPQYKGMHLEEENMLENVKIDIKNEIDKMKIEKDLTEGKEKEPVEVESNDITQSPNTKLRMKMKQRQINLRTKTNEDLMSPLEKEFNRYESFSITDKYVNILKWWMDHERVLPLLASISKKVLTIPASSSKSERVFSTGGNFVTKKRHRLASKKVEHLIVIKENKGQIEEFKKSGMYDLKKQENKPFSLIEVDEVIQNIVNDEMDDLSASNIFSSDTEEDILFEVDSDDDISDND